MSETTYFPTLAALKRGIEELEEASRVKFVVLNKDKAFGNDFNFSEKKSFRLRWEYDDDLHPCKIPFTGVPFIAVGRKMMDCHQGKDRNIRQKERYALQIDTDKNPNSKRKKQVLQRTKKVCCPATITITQIARLPDIKIKENKEWTKRMAAAEFRKMLSKGHKPQQKSEFYALFPRDEDHKGHPIKNEAAGLREPTIPEVVDKVRALTREGITKVSVMKQHIVNFLHKEMHITDTLRRRYMPTNSDISNIMSSVRRKAKHNPDSMADFFSEMRRKNPSDLVLYRANSPKHELLFCYQSTWQSRLLNRYGNHSCLLDAAHRTKACIKPLFLLFVRTNVAYVSVGAFVVDNENVASIQEALMIFAKWNPNWSPVNFMVDVSSNEIKAVESCFKDCRVVLSDFHRERAWAAFTNKSMDQKKDSVLTLLRRIAHAESAERYRESLSRLLGSTEMKEHEGFRSLLTNTWLPQAKRWVRCFQDESFYIAVHAGSGVEKQNEALKYDNMEDYENCSLKDLVSGLIMTFFPDSYRIYLERNARSSPGYSQYNNNIPSFLRNRPRSIVRHIQDRMRDGITKECIQHCGDGIFTFLQANGNHSLSFGKEGAVPHCTCRDWQTHYLPCKHFCAVFAHFPEWQWDSLSDAYRNNPILTLDEAFLVEDNQPQVEPREGELRDLEIVEDPAQEEEEERKRAVRECSDTVKQINASLKKLKDTTHLQEVQKSLRELLEDVNGRVSLEALVAQTVLTADTSIEQDGASGLLVL
ncbi:uncharacterized protein [Diadema setosum]|uniref:uncharacterized protein n=1 Tax=Diadema setosum TaxID=31175 RepID=UPI003B3B5BF3